jgi:hypothetical protein
MATVTQNDLRIRNAHNMVLHLSNELEPCYMFIGRPEPWMSMVENNPRPRLMAGDESVPYPENNWNDFYKTWDQMLTLRKILSKDVFHMIPRITWTSGVTYDMYRHDYSEYVRSFSNAQNLYDALFFVVSRTNNVYVCLDNNQGTPSLVEPLSESSEPFYTSDGYQWLKLYTVGFYEQTEHSSNNFIPITNDSVNSRVSGAVYTVVVDSRGDEYVPSAFNELYDVDHCYCHINGDGEGAVAKVTIVDGRIFQVRVVRNGQGYTRAKLNFRPNKVYNSLFDLDNNQNGFNPRGNNAFRSTVIISPPGGWGTDVEEDKIVTLARQLGGTRVGIYSRFSHNTEDYIEQGTFRQLGILDEVVYAEPFVGNPGTLSAMKAVIVTEPINTQNLEYTVGEIIHQIQVDENDPSVVHTAKGIVVGWDDSPTPATPTDEKYQMIRYIQDPEVHADVDGNLYPFKGDSMIVGEKSKKEAAPNLSFGLPVQEKMDDMFFHSGYSIDEVVKYSGNMLYLTNVNPITRVTTQSERVSLILSY